MGNQKLILLTDDGTLPTSAFGSLISGSVTLAVLEAGARSDIPGTFARVGLETGNDAIFFV